VFAAAGEENAQPAYKGGTWLCPKPATCDSTGDMPAIDRGTRRNRCDDRGPEPAREQETMIKNPGP
jgi:hypothetical protein